MKNIFLYSIVGVIIASSVIFAVVYDTYNTDAKTASVNDTQEKSNYVYVPSNITKANPKVIHPSGHSLMAEIYIENIQESVEYTVRGKIISVNDPIEWESDGVTPRKINDQYVLVPQVYGFVPITLHVDEIYKGEELRDNEITFYLQTIKVYDPVRYLQFPSDPSYEIGDEVIVHLSKSNPFGPFEEGPYMLALAKYSSYKINNNLAFNAGTYEGMQISVVAREAIPTPDFSPYLQSNITKSNQKIIYPEGNYRYATHNIADIRDKIDYTIRGKVLSVDDPIQWNDIPNIQDVFLVPVTMSVMKVYKGDLVSDTFTFYLRAEKIDSGRYILHKSSPNLENGDEIIVHLTVVDAGSSDQFKEGIPIPALGRYALYKIINETAFNKNYPSGILIPEISNESRD